MTVTEPVTALHHPELDGELPAELVERRRVVRDYCLRAVRPEAPRRERIEDPDERFPWDWVEDLSRMGLRTMVLPPELGGWGADTLACCVLAEELAAGDMGLAVIFDQTWKITPVLSVAANDEQRARFLPPFRENDRFLLAVALNEPKAGSDNWLPYTGPGGGTISSGRREGDGWVLDGVKAPISNGGVAGLYVVMVRTVPGTSGVDGLTPFFVEPDRPGFTVEFIYEKSAQRLVHNGHLVFRGCRIPDSNRIGPEAEAMRFYRDAVRSRGFPEAGATALGTARAALEEAWAFAQTRVQGGAAIIEHQAVSLMLAEMQIELEAARSLVYRAARAAESDRDLDGRLQIMAKVHATQTAFRVAGRAIEVFGRMGIMRECPAEKYLRDTTSFLHSEGANQVLALRIANMSRHLTGKF
jgi:alkylation response protein AidB-like acyl-CoA dehydrogenase